VALGFFHHRVPYIYKTKLYPLANLSFNICKSPKKCWWNWHLKGSTQGSRSRAARFKEYVLPSFSPPPPKKNLKFWILLRILRAFKIQGSRPSLPCLCVTTSLKIMQKVKTWVLIPNLLNHRHRRRCSEKCFSFQQKSEEDDSTDQNWNRIWKKNWNLFLKICPFCSLRPGIGPTTLCFSLLSLSVCYIRKKMGKLNSRKRKTFAFSKKKFCSIALCITLYWLYNETPQVKFVIGTIGYRAVSVIRSY